MPIASGQALSVNALLAERDERRRHDRDAEEQLQRRKASNWSSCNNGWCTRA